MGVTGWQGIAATQAGLITRAQLAGVGVDRWAVRHRIETGRWIEHTPTVISTTTGPPSREQLMWLGVLHGGVDAIIGDLTAAELGGLANWHRDDITVLVPQAADVGDGYPGVAFERTRRSLTVMKRPGRGLPVSRLEPAVLLFAAYQRSPRTAEGVLSAAVQQRLTSAPALLTWIDRLKPLRGAPRFRRVLAEIGGGAHSSAELAVRRLCREFELRPPARRVRRRDASGRLRFTDCEWSLPDGRVLILEVDGSFHMSVEHWEDDLARQRALSSPGRTIIRCTARELRDAPESVARDLRMLGVPAA